MQIGPISKRPRTHSGVCIFVTVKLCGNSKCNSIPFALVFIHRWSGNRQNQWKGDREACKNRKSASNFETPTYVVTEEITHKASHHTHEQSAVSNWFRRTDDMCHADDSNQSRFVQTSTELHEIDGNEQPQQYQSQQQQLFTRPAIRNAIVYIESTFGQLSNPKWVFAKEESDQFVYSGWSNETHCDSACRSAENGAHHQFTVQCRQQPTQAFDVEPEHSESIFNCRINTKNGEIAIERLLQRRLVACVAKCCIVRLAGKVKLTKLNQLPLSVSVQHG